MTTSIESWPELAVGLFDKLTERNAQIAYDFQNFEIDVPSDTGDSPNYGKWRVSGMLKIRTTAGGAA